MTAEVVVVAAAAAEGLGFWGWLTMVGYFVALQMTTNPGDFQNLVEIVAFVVLVHVLAHLLLLLLLLVAAAAVLVVVGSHSQECLMQTMSCETLDS